MFKKRHMLNYLAELRPKVYLTEVYRILRNMVRVKVEATKLFKRGKTHQKEGKM